MQGLHYNKNKKMTTRTAARYLWGSGPASGLAAAIMLAGAVHAAPAATALKTDVPLTRALSARPAHGWVSVIAKVGGPLTAAQQAQMAALGAEVTRHLSIISSLELRVPAGNLNKIAALPFITHLSSDGAVAKCDEFTTGHTGADIALQQYGLTGTGVAVAIVDSGIGDSHDVQDSLYSKGHRLLASVNFVPDHPGDAIPADGHGDAKDHCGHGTHVAGILAGNGESSTDPDAAKNHGQDKKYTHHFYGIARDAGLVNVRVLDDQGGGTVGGVLAGIQWVVANAKTYNIRVMNLSLGHPVGDTYANDPLCQAVEAAWKAGIVVVCAAGNGGRLNGDTYTPGLDNEGWGTAYGSIDSPGNDPDVITVGAMKQTDGLRTDDTIATYSSRGPSGLDLVLKPDLVAPGNQVISTLAHDSYLDKTFSASNQVPQAAYMVKADPNHMSDSYFRLSGTSMAAPVVAGAAALLLQKDPTLTPDTVKARLMVSANKWTDPQGNADPLSYGAGYLDIPAALSCPLVATEAAVSPTLYLDNSGNFAIAMDRAIWGNRAIWGKNGIWGAGSLTDLRAIWGKRALWGSSSDTEASRAIWGRTGVAEERALWGSRAIWGRASVSGSSGSTASSVDLSNVAINGE